MKLVLRCGTNLLAAAAFVALPASAQTELNTPEQKAGYSIGVNIGGTLAGQGLAEDLDIGALLQGVQDGISGELKLSQEELVAAIEAFSAVQQAKAQAEMQQLAQAGRDFLAQNSSKEGVSTTASGLQYEVISRASDASARSPAASDTVNVHYHGTMIDGTVFDSSVDRGEPITFPLNGVIPGWTEGLQLMKVGDKYRFFIPSDLAYGDSGAGPIPPNSTLIFEVELLGIQ
jgi:FKBP-type peptidyl-prolyl cis-trans isomerase FklB